MDYNQQPNRWSDSSNSPYYNQPTHSPYRKELFSIASMVLGLLSLFSACTGIFPIPLGCLSILFAVLAFRKGKAKNPMAISGLVLSIIGVVSGVLLTIYSFILLPQTMKDPVFRQQMDVMTSQLYGMSFEELMKEYYGVDITEIIEE